VGLGKTIGLNRNMYKAYTNYCLLVKYQSKKIALILTIMKENVLNATTPT